jgi:hypothetical protein
MRPTEAEKVQDLAWAAAAVEAPACQPKDPAREAQDQIP